MNLQNVLMFKQFSEKYSVSLVSETRTVTTVAVVLQIWRSLSLNSLQPHRRDLLQRNGHKRTKNTYYVYFHLKTNPVILPENHDSAFILIVSLIILYESLRDLFLIKV